MAASRIHRTPDATAVPTGSTRAAGRLTVLPSPARLRPDPDPQLRAQAVAMTNMQECPHCARAFVVVPGPCPSCGEHVEQGSAPVGQDRVVQYRLNRLAQAGGFALAGLISGGVAWFATAPALGVGLLVAGLAAAVFVLSVV